MPRIKILHVIVKCGLAAVRSKVRAAQAAALATAKAEAATARLTDGYDVLRPVLLLFCARITITA